MQHISSAIETVLQSIKQRHIDVLKRTDEVAIQEARAELPNTCRVCGDELAEQIVITPQGAYVVSRHCPEHGQQYYNALIQQTPFE